MISNLETQDLPPESFLVHKEHELDWFNSNAFLERKGSTKISFSGSSNLNSISNPRRSFHSSPSHRLSLNSKSKSSIIGLPKLQKSDRNLRRTSKPENVRMFRSYSEPGGKPVMHVPEPGSPRVSCMGRVRSKKGREKRTGLWASLRAIFGTGQGVVIGT
ncbi:hypothetical protein ACSBR1_027523 [Camellia fascicularis]